MLAVPVSSFASLALLRQIAEQMSWVERYSKGKQEPSSAAPRGKGRAVLKPRGLVG